MSKSPVTCHVLDSSVGRPAAGVPVQLQKLKSADGPTAGFDVLADGVTDHDGRCMQLYPEAGPGQKREDLIKLQAGNLYKVVFKTKDYFEGTGRKSFYPWVEITFEVPSPTEHYHIPLLISPYSYTTYRGS
ncbi:transthyretin [Dichomitus squalens]|uniref:transthyretin n=1 Tax=Dichomitus squalens (strain LYAD-421) TaxID=732165 RepID=UPI00044119A9|nr:transthyretin [Dichomitus squalens LYAD-421 SS1]EJF67196.1 transthyretin [Dichomitus squalens LYAD-421 SS1]TBU49324.1 transthyretin [Dichomitus squalens]